MQVQTPAKNENDGFKEQKETEQWSGVGEGQSRVTWGQKGSKDPDRATIVGVMRGGFLLHLCSCSFEKHHTPKCLCI